MAAVTRSPDTLHPAHVPAPGWSEGRRPIAFLVLAVVLWAPSWWLGDAPLAPGVELPASALAAVVPAVAAVLLLLGEDRRAIGPLARWTGYARPRLVRHLGAVGAGLVVGVVWSAVHLVPWAVHLGHDVTWVTGMVLGTVGLRVLVVTLSDAWGAPVVAVVVHAALNVWAVGVPASYEPAVTGPLLLLAALVAVAATGRGPATRVSGSPA